VKRLKLSTVAGLLLAVGLLTGCALLMDEPTEQAQELEESSDSKWLIASQGEEEPEACEEELSRNEARREAKEALKEEDEAQLLEQTLAALGKRLYVWRAKGCKVEEDESGAEAQGLRALAEEEETILVEVPAGRDAALYLVESGDEGNYWVSLKEEAEGGERLIHIEVGLEGEAQLQGLSTDTGAISFFLPDEEGTLEIAGQVQELLEGSVRGTESAGLWAMSSEEFDWSQAEVLILEEDSEEAEALLVVPAVETEGQRLWDRSQGRIAMEQALYAKVKVKRGKMQGSTRPSFKVVDSPSQVKRGSEIRFKSFDLCPYRYYGRVSPFRKPLCHYWERKAASKVHKITFNRAIRNLPDIHNQLPTAGQQSSKIIGVVGKDRGLLVYNRDLTPEELLQLFDSTASGTAASSTEEQVEGQQVQVVGQLLLIFLDFIKDLIDLWNRMSEAERNAFMHALSLIYGDPDPGSAAEDFYGRTSPEGQAYTKVIDSIIQALQKHLGLSWEQAKQEALSIMGIFVSTLKASSKPGLMTDIVTHAGVAGIIAFVYLLDTQQYAQQHMFDGYIYGKYAYPADILSFFEELLKLKGIIENWSLFLEHLAAAAAQAAFNAGTPAGDAALEMIAKLTLLQNLFFKMHARGWGLLTYGYHDCYRYAGCMYFDFYGYNVSLTVSGFDGSFPWHIFGWVEPYLSLDDVDRILQQIENAVNWIFQGFLADPFQLSGMPAIVQVIDKYDPRALDRLCSCVSSRYYGVPVIIIADGEVKCHSLDVTDEGAEDICREMGLCDDPDRPSGDQGESPPEGTYSLPIGDPDTGDCSPGQAFCLI